MNPVYTRIRDKARLIVSRYPQPAFYSDHKKEFNLSTAFFNENKLVLRLRKNVAGKIDDDYGHGIKHIKKVAIDAGALVMIEGKLAKRPDEMIARHMLQVQFAGVLHDIVRKEKNHAVAGAKQASKILKRYPLSAGELKNVCFAIRNHEAFAPIEKTETIEGELISNCLYDADKFRWGPDNFTDTIWDMLSTLDPPLPVFMRHYPKGMAFLTKVRDTFRSKTGKKYGPRFIDLGIAIGDELYHVIQKEFA